jgi:predicted dehydrogenase
MSSGPRLLVLGAGSAGARHARLLTEAGASVAIADPDSARASAVPGCDAVPYDLDRLEGYDGIVVASPSAFHAEQTAAALATPAHVLVEKPLATASDGLDDLVHAGARRVMVGFNLRFHEPLERAADLVLGGRAGRLSSLRVWFGSWLPDWRPDTDYRQTYSARSALGGGILGDASHELDILVWLLGTDLSVVGALVERLGPLEIDVEDTVKAVLRSNEGVAAEVSLDYLSRRYRRGLEATGEAATVRLDWSRGVLEVEDAAGTDVEQADVPVAHSYERQARHFLAFVAGDATPPVDIATGAASVRLADAIRRAAA